VCLCAIVIAAAGCQTDSFWSKLDPRQAFSKKPEPPPPAVEGYVMRGSGLEKDARPVPGTVQAELDGAKILYQKGKYAEAAKVFHGLANNSKNPPQVAEEALFFEADSLYMQGHYPKAESTFKKLLHEFRLNGRFHEQANRRLFDIANYWLDDTRKIMRAYEEYKGGKRWGYWPLSYVHFQTEKPLVDIEGRAIEALEEVRLNDMTGPLGEKALWYIATVKFFRAEYHDADYYYTQIYENYPNQPLACKAVKQSIICKIMATGGSLYDGRDLQKARQLIDKANAFPELGKDEEWLRRQIISISQQQADKDWRIAEFYRRTGHPGPAYFCYELVRRRYPDTTYSEKAVQRMKQLEPRLEREQRKKGPALGTPQQALPPVGDQPIIGPEPRQLPPNLMSPPGRGP
jgi:outer membrane protein assembly factor BamD (BamD/ComL family)